MLLFLAISPKRNSFDVQFDDICDYASECYFDRLIPEFVFQI